MKTMRRITTLALALLMILPCYSAMAEFTPVSIGETDNGTREYVEPPEGEWNELYSGIVNIRTVKG